MPQGMSQWARAVVVGASQRVNRDMGLLRSTKVGTALVSGVSRSVRATVGPVKRERGRAPREARPDPAASSVVWSNLSPRRRSMRSVTYSMGMSVDGYIVGPDGRFDWTAP